MVGSIELGTEDLVTVIAFLQILDLLPSLTVIDLNLRQLACTHEPVAFSLPVHGLVGIARVVYKSANSFLLRP